jgi:AcrR family transcriptional regulator
MARKVDRRVQRTHRLLREALISLIREKGFESLSVQEIIDRANVGRATFYAHFDNKEDLLVSGFDDLRASLKRRQQESLSRGGSSVEERAFAFSYELLAHVDEYRLVFRAMVGKHSGAVVQHLVHKLLVELVRDDVKVLIPRGDGNLSAAEPLAQFIAGGLFGLLMWWLESKTRVSVEEMNQLFRRLAIPTLKAMLR